MNPNPMHSQPHMQQGQQQYHQQMQGGQMQGGQMPMQRQMHPGSQNPVHMGQQQGMQQRKPPPHMMQGGQFQHPGNGPMNGSNPQYQQRNYLFNLNSCLIIYFQSR